MLYFRLFILLMFLSASGIAQTKKPAGVKSVSAKATVTTLIPKTFDDSLSYAIGISVASFYKNLGAKNINVALMSEAVRNVYNNKEHRFSDEVIQDVFMKAEQKFTEEKAAKANKESNDFLSSNKIKPGVKTTSSGLQYQILKEGTGPKPTASDTVVCHYAGSLLNGKEFDNSYKRGEPITFAVTGVIKGWTEALQLMSAGSKWRLFIPPDLGYGDRGAGGGEIPPGAVLIFEVELLEIK